jgi:general secretion pathway protein L
MNTSNSASLQLIGIANNLGASVRDCISAFADNLAGGVPGADQCRSMIMADGKGLSISARQETGGWKPAFKLDGSLDSVLAPVAKHLKQLPRGPIMLRAGTGRAVVARQPLPAAAIDVLPAVVRNKVESLAPWPLAEALWGYRVAGKSENGQLLVDVGVVSRKTAFGLLDGLEAAGIKISRFEISPDIHAESGIEIDVHGEDRQKLARRKITLAMTILALVAAGIGGYGAYRAFDTYREASGIDSDLVRLTQSLRDAGATAGTSAQLSEANRLYFRKLESRPAIEILNSLTKLIPDGIWLNALDLDGGQLTISGRGNQVPGVIETLESSVEFKDVNFASATQREPDASADSFAISAVVESKEAQQ